MIIVDKEELKAFSSCHRIWQGIPGIVKTKGGRTFVSFYSGETKETYGNYAILLRSDTDGDFGEPIAVVKKEGKFRCFDPVLWIDPLNRLWFIWNVMPGDEVYASICENPDAKELVWHKEFCIGHGVMMNKPTVLSSGEWLFPIAMWKNECFEEVLNTTVHKNEESRSYVYKTSDNGKSFVRLGGADVRNRSFDEHMLVELKNGVLMMLVRTTYGIGVSYSYDRGRNWSTGENSNLGGPCSRFHIRRLKSGRILLINHVNFTGRNNLTALLSEDDGKTFPYSLLLDERNFVSYPDAFESDDGYIYITYDRERGCSKHSLEEAYACAREILTAKITEKDVLKGSLVDKGSFLKNVVSKLNKLSSEDPDPYHDPISDIESWADTLISDGGDILKKVFDCYPIDCIEIDKFDMSKLDTLVDQFYKSNCKDRKILLKLIDLIRTTPKSIPDTYPLIERVRKYIENHLTEEISLIDIAKEVNVSVYYLSHIFKSVTGITPIEFRNELRITKAKQLLIHTNETISEISNKCGFGSASYFTEMFSRSEKIPPTEFRKYHS